jgi:hypothetical protein
VFLAALWPRLLLSLCFTLAGFYGNGGDAEIYNLAGVYMKDLIVDPSHASIDAAIQRWGWSDAQPWYQTYWYVVSDAEDAVRTHHFTNTTTPTVFIHALLYMIWEQPFLFVAMTSLLSAAAVSWSSRVHGLSKRESRWLIYNPISIFFAATHFKESIVESLLLFAVPLFYKQRRVVLGVVVGALTAVFRTTYAPILVLFFASKYLRKFPLKILLSAELLLFAILPPFYWDYPVENVGFVYALVNRNELTKKVLGTLVGAIQPIPFRDGLTSAGGVFMAAYGVFYYALLFQIGMVLLFSKRKSAYVTSTMIIMFVISYWTIGTAAAKARYFAPFLPILVLGAAELRRPVYATARRLSRRLGRAPSPPEPPTPLGPAQPELDPT